MNKPVLCPYIRRALYDILDPPLHFDERILFDYELLYVKSGNIRITTSDGVCEASAGHVILLKPGQRHVIDIYGTEKFIQPHIHFDLEYFQDRETVPVSFKTYEDLTEEELSHIRPDILNTLLADIPMMIRLDNAAFFETLLFDVIHEYENPIQFHELSLYGMFYQLLNHYLSEVYWKEAKPLHTRRQQMQLIKQFIEHNDNRPLKMEEVSQLLFVEKHTISKLYKETYGETPIQYHAKLRIRRAKMMIQLTNLPIGEISERLGYDSIHSFSRAFKNIEGAPPSAFRHDRPGTVMTEPEKPK